MEGISFVHTKSGKIEIRGLGGRSPVRVTVEQLRVLAENAHALQGFVERQRVQTQASPHGNR